MTHRRDARSRARRCGLLLLGAAAAACSTQAPTTTPLTGICVSLAHGANPSDAGTCFVAADGGWARLGLTAGSGFADGGLSFTFGSAYQAFIESGCGDAGTVRALSLSFGAQATACSLVGPLYGTGGPALELLLVGDPAPGTFSVGSLLPDEPSAVLRLPGGAAVQTAYAGSVTLDTLPACGASGSFALTFDAPDGGAPLELSGSFSAGYCIGTGVYGLPTHR
ncbi:MAG: hypothetical protein IPJ65_30980 [Archangiaceae bacterium]|nr:hypothetical protein [Archangiaceae bacterium]